MKKYSSPEERAAARREQNRLAQARHRAKVKAAQAAPAMPKAPKLPIPEIIEKPKRPILTEDAKRERRREQNRLSAQRSRDWIKSLDSRQRNLWNELKGYGIKVKRSEFGMWEDYISKRSAQQRDKRLYEFDRWVQDFAEELEDMRMSAKQLKDDFEAYKAEQLSFLDMLENTTFEDWQKI